MTPSVLDCFILSLLDRGLETPYDLQRVGGISVGSSLPALRRLELSLCIKRKAVTNVGNRVRHGYRVLAEGKRLARDGWRLHLEDDGTKDIEAIFRLIDIAHFQNAEPSVIAKLLEPAIAARTTRSKKTHAKSRESSGSDIYRTLREDWSMARLAAEGKFLAGLANAISKSPPTATQDEPGNPVSRAMR
jgi:DNA-binding PadR family transcriptional regulator